MDRKRKFVELTIKAKLQMLSELEKGFPCIKISEGMRFMLQLYQI